MFLFPARIKKFQSKMKALEWSQQFSHCKSMGIFSDAQRQHGQILLNFKLIRDLIVVLVTCKNEDIIKTEGTRVLITLNIDFLDAQGQVTL